MVKNLVCMAPWMGKRPLSPHHVSFLILFLKQKGSNLYTLQNFPQQGNS